MAKKYLVAVGTGLHNSQATVRKLDEPMVEPQRPKANALWKLGGKELAERGNYSPNAIYVDSAEEMNDLLYSLPEMSAFGDHVDPSRT